MMAYDAPSQKRQRRIFLCLACGKGMSMKQDKDNQTQNEVIIVSDEAGMQLYLSEKAANRLSWIITGILALISLPVFILAFMSL